MWHIPRTTVPLSVLLLASTTSTSTTSTEGPLPYIHPISPSTNNTTLAAQNPNSGIRMQKPCYQSLIIAASHVESNKSLSINNYQFRFDMDP
jgi:hypothetical protein